MDLSPWAVAFAEFNAWPNGIAGIEAQELDQDCNPIAVPAECRRFVSAIEALDTQMARWQQRLRHAGGAMKSDLLRTIRQLSSQRDSAIADLAGCRREHGATPRVLAPSELTANFTGTATLRTTDSDAPGPFDVDFDVDIRFSRNRCSVTITRLPAITLKTPDLDVVGVVTVTVTKTGGGTGTFHPVSGTMSLPLTLHFHYDTFLVSGRRRHFQFDNGPLALRRWDL